MMLFSANALLANATCLGPLWRFRKLNLNMRSALEGSRNEVASNLGMLVAGVLVAWSGSFWQDVVIAAVIAAIFLRSAFSVLTSACPVFRARLSDGGPD